MFGTHTRIHPRNTQIYSRHLGHALEGIGRHRHDALVAKVQLATLRKAGPCAA